MYLDLLDQRCSRHQILHDLGPHLRRLGRSLLVKYYLSPVDHQRSLAIAKARRYRDPSPSLIHHCSQDKRANTGQQSQQRNGRYSHSVNHFACKLFAQKLAMASE